MSRHPSYTAVPCAMRMCVRLTNAHWAALSKPRPRGLMLEPQSNPTAPSHGGTASKRARPARWVRCVCCAPGRITRKPALSHADADPRPLLRVGYSRSAGLRTACALPPRRSPSVSAAPTDRRSGTRDRDEVPFGSARAISRDPTRLIIASGRETLHAVLSTEARRRVPHAAVVPHGARSALYSPTSNRSRCCRGCDRRYWFGARTRAPKCAAACHGQRGS
jgi:hypothetical protein